MPYIVRAERLENKDNKTKIISAESTDEQYPSARAVHDALEDAVDNFVLEIDSELSDSSLNPVQNKVIQAELSKKVDKIDGKSLSTNDFTDDQKTKLEGIDDGANKTVVDASLSDSSTNPVQNKVVKSELDKKVTTESGKGLSTNDFTDAYKTKLDNISEEANKVEIDSSLSGTSTNPVQNKVVKAAIEDAKKYDANGKEIQRTYTSMIPYGTKIDANTDLNNIEFLKVGNYYCSKNADVQTLLNCPTSLAFMMQVSNPLSTAIDNESSATWVYRLRKLITHKGDEYYQFINSGYTAGDFTYGPWKKTAKIEDIQTSVDPDDVNSLIDNRIGQVSVLAYKTSSNTYTDAFQAALAANRRVFVPGGEYELNDTLLIRENCELELAQDAVLRFTQTDKNCITLLRLASLKGNHATIFVPYNFSATVLNSDTNEDETYAPTGEANNDAVPPFTKWDPQWRMSRYITDINICKPDHRGFHYSYGAGETVNGVTYEKACYGTAVNFECHRSSANVVNFMWGISATGLRISGAFETGIRVWNDQTRDADGKDNSPWNHDARIEAVIDACETGVLLHNANILHIAATIQPRLSYSVRTDSNGKHIEQPYAKWGIKMIDCECIDLTQSTVWDWHLSLGGTKTADQSEYQHIAMYGNCPGLVLGDFLYHIDTTHDIRAIVYSENDIKYPTTKPSNLETMTVLQEPITKWFKPKDGDPIFFNGNGEYKLVTQDTLDGYFNVDAVKKFEDLLPGAKGLDGNPFGNGGYTTTRCLKTDGTDVGSDGYYGCTGLIPCKPGDTIYLKGIDLQASHKPYNAVNDKGVVNGDGMCRVAFLDSNFNAVTNAKGNPVIGNHAMMHEDNYYGKYYKTADGCKFYLPAYAESTYNQIAYLRFGFHTGKGLGALPMISVNAPIEYTMEGFLSENIYVKPSNVDGLSSYVESLIDAKINSIPLASKDGEVF